MALAFYLTATAHARPSNISETLSIILTQNLKKIVFIPPIPLPTTVGAQPLALVLHAVDPAKLGIGVLFSASHTDTRLLMLGDTFPSLLVELQLLKIVMLASFYTSLSSPALRKALLNSPGVRCSGFSFLSFAIRSTSTPYADTSFFRSDISLVDECRRPAPDKPTDSVFEY